jgi:hypothetical protein
MSIAGGKHLYITMADLRIAKLARRTRIVLCQKELDAYLEAVSHNPAGKVRFHIIDEDVLSWMMFWCVVCVDRFSIGLALVVACLSIFVHVCICMCVRARDHGLYCIVAFNNSN